jgi:hypothetical protein
MALTPDAKRDRAVVNQFLAQDATPQSGFLGQLDNDIRANRQQRRAQQMAQRGQNTLGRGLGRMNSIGGSAVMNPSGAGGRQIIQQGMGQIPAVA